ncbi:transporter substrate-binding domain-containing protein [Chitinibacter tainanensis]|uniref:transporter substrate-binding domain-containing protein n=1 Tax=Chitinibacter tainanensis TaxID=230667 RepID=UPI000686B248|nr:transporter substrate-binding domain-containing protein [Chitinibacter tainanensis]
MPNPYSRLLLSCLLCGLCWGSSVYAEQPLVVRFAPEKDYGPFIYADQHGAIRGLSAEMLNALLPYAGLEIQYLPAQPLASILQQVQQQQADLVSSLRPTPERGRYLGFTSPYVAVPAVLVTPSSHSDANLQALAGQIVAVGQGYAVEEYVRRLYPQVIWHSVENDQQALQLLNERKVSGVVADLASVLFIQRQFGQTAWHIGGSIGFQYELAFAYRKDRPEIGERLNHALRQLPNTEREVILQRWLTAHDLSAPTPLQERLLLLGVMLLAAAGLIITILLLRPRHAQL